MKIQIGQWHLRHWDDSDSPSIAKYANNRKIWLNIGDMFPHPYTLSDAREFIESVRSQNPVTTFAIASESETIGSIGLHLQRDIHRRCAEIGYWLGEPFWGQGIATLAAKAIVDYAFANFDLVRLYAKVFEWNTASARVLEKAGFTLEARMRKDVIKDGKTIDQLQYALIRDE